MPNLKCLIPAWLVATLGAVAPANAAEALTEECTVCRSQQSLEQVIETAGSLEPDDCRHARITRLSAGADAVCVLDLSGEAETLLGSVRSLAETEEWWLPCAALGFVSAD